MTTDLSFGFNSITVYKYEPFSYTISNPYPLTLPVTTVSTGIPASLVVTTLSNVVFSSGGFGGGTSPNELIVIDVSSGLAVSSNTVAIAPGRFRDSNGASISNTVFTFFKNEAISPATFNASISLQSPLLTFPALPAGLTLTKTASNQFTLAGTPVVEVPSSNYQIIGQGSNSDSGKVVTAVVNMSVGAERIQLDVSGSPIVFPMVIDTPITPRSVYAKYPLYSSGALKYSWPTLPDGIFFTDLNGVPVSSGFQPTDASSTLILQGTPTLAAAKSFAIAGITPYTANVQALRLTPPNISNSTAFTFQFEPTVLFNDVTIPPYYTGVTLDPSATFFTAKTYFASDASISTIFSPDLRSDLSLNFVPSQARAYLTGTPTSVGTNSYTITASNTAGRTRDILATIAVVNDTVSFDYSVTPAVDTCYNFILSRPVSVPKTGYYSYPIQFTANAASGRSVVYSAPGLAGTGMALDVSGARATISGVPDTVTSLTTLAVTASAVGSPATASTTIKFAVLTDQFTFADVSSTLFQWVQNRAITPIQLAVTTLSERPVIGFSAAGLPSGLMVSASGEISGTPTVDGSGTIVVTATTGYTSGTASYDYFTRADDILVALANATETVTGSFSVQFRGVPYSGDTPVEFRIVPNLQPYQYPTPLNLSMTTGGLLTGNLEATSQLQPRYSFDISTNAGALVPAYPTKAVINVSNYQTPRHLMIGASPAGDVRVLAKDEYGIQVSTAGDLQLNSSFSTWYQTLSGNGYTANGGAYDIAQSSNTVCAIIGANMYFSRDGGATWRPGNAPNPFGGAFNVIASGSGSNWLALGLSDVGTIVRQSFDDGATWSDTLISLSDLFFTVGNQLLYRNGRYILVQKYQYPPGPTDAPAIWYAEEDEVTKPWTSVPGPFYTGSATADAFEIATDGTTLVVAGSGPTVTSSNVFKSTDNGTTWTAVSNPFESTIDQGAAYGIQYGNGQWLLSGTNTVYPDGFVAYSSDLTTWTSVVPSPPTAITNAFTFDGNAWIGFGEQGGTAVVNTVRLEPSVTQIAASASMGVSVIPKRSLFGLLPNGTPSATITIPYNAGGYSFVLPTVPWPALYQYVSTTIPVQLTAAPEFIYYYASQLPRGLTLTTEATGVTASIIGTPSQFSDRPTQTVLFARLPQANIVVALVVPLRVILPYVQKRTDAASGFTSLLRQYTIVNGAQNARDSRTFPQVDRLLGEFTAPYPPNVTTQMIDPKCLNPNTCK